MSRWKPPPWPDEIRKVTLTEREGQVLYAFCSGWGYPRIIDEYGLTVDQVKYTVKGVFDAFGVRDRGQCVAQAISGQVDVHIEEAADRRRRSS